MVIIWAGLLAGAIHVISGPDHLLALAPYSFQTRQNRPWIGLKWGLGHGLGIAVMAITVLALKTHIDVTSISDLAECCVGLVLIFIGVKALRTSQQLVIHDHPHTHDSQGEPEDHSHLHIHVGSTKHAKSTSHQVHSHAPGWIGLLHGVAGTGHVFGLVPALGLSLPNALLYLSAYVLASILAMMLCVASLGLLAQRLGSSSIPKLIKISGATALVTGVVWLYSFRAIGLEVLGLAN